MADKLTKIDNDTLEVENTSTVVKTRISRAEIQTQIDHKNNDINRINIDIASLEAKIAILDK
ncbi:hypothetical protein KAR91_32365 [Candidatus Pacearchaeota archaeon]|nr:hypothetical protein [Candidatus Pacearchaeota archaeon]